MLAWTKYNAEDNADSLKSGHKFMQQSNIINMITNKNETQQKHRHGTVSQNYRGGALTGFTGSQPRPQLLSGLKIQLFGPREGFLICINRSTILNVNVHDI